MAKVLKTIVRMWSYPEATLAVPYVRSVLGSLRESYVSSWHYFRLSGRDGADPWPREAMRRHRGEGIEALGELARLGVLAYDNPLRGIALFPFSVQDRNGPRPAHYVYKDSRDGIDSFVFNDELCRQNDLLCDERPVPADWKQPKAVPMLEHRMS